MENKLINIISKLVTVDYCQYTFVENPDGFLRDDDVCHLLSQEQGIEVVKGSQLYLRLHYELRYKQNHSGKYVYICDDINALLPDMKRNGVLLKFSIRDVFPLFADKNVLTGLNYDVVAKVYDEYAVSNRRVAIPECHRMVDEAKRQVAQEKERSVDNLIQRMRQLQPDWNAGAKDTMMKISDFIVEAVRNGVYEHIAPIIDEYNSSFQFWIEQYYRASLNSNHLLRPKSVNKIRSHLGDKYGNDCKIALVVVDGLSFWQYAILEKYLSGCDLQVNSNTILAWIPTITMLSRQAIFRGETPSFDYKQSPASEQKLWRETWNMVGIPASNVQYLSDKDEFAINEGITRLAYVTVEMDEKMHSSTDYKDLLSLTENWCPRIAEHIKLMRSMGFEVYLTTDHGSVLSKGWKQLTQVEKVFLYKDGSRGKRHLIYNNCEPKNQFLREHENEIDVYGQDDWLSIRTDSCFEREGKQIITHGGCHFLEVVIPFATIV